MADIGKNDRFNQSLPGKYDHSTFLIVKKKCWSIRIGAAWSIGTAFSIRFLRCTVYGNKLDFSKIVVDF